MDLITLVILIIVVGVAMWAVNQLPMQPQIKTILNAVVIIVLVLFLIRVLVGPLPVIRLR